MKIRYVGPLGNRSTCEHPVDVVHQLCRDNPTLSRQNLIALAQAAGVNYFTACTQVYSLKAGEAK